MFETNLNVLNYYAKLKNKNELTNTFSFLFPETTNSLLEFCPKPENKPLNYSIVFQKSKNDLIIEELNQELKEIKELLKVNNILKKEILFVDDLTVITPYTKEYIYQLIHKQEIPVHYREGKKGSPSFYRTEIEKWLTAYKVKSKYCIEKEATQYLNNK